MPKKNKEPNIHPYNLYREGKFVCAERQLKAAKRAAEAIEKKIPRYVTKGVDMKKNNFDQYATTAKLNVSITGTHIEICEDTRLNMLDQIARKDPYLLPTKYDALRASQIKDCAVRLAVRLSVDVIGGIGPKEEMFYFDVTDSINPEYKINDNSREATEKYEDTIRLVAQEALENCARSLCFRYNVTSWQCFRLLKTTAICNVEDWRYM